MPKAAPDQFLSVDDYRKAFAAFYAICGLILLAFGKHELDLKNRIIRNLVARTAMMVRGVMNLWDLNDFQDGWILHRSLLDRLFHLVDIDENNRYESFENWSFYERYKVYEVMRGDPQVPDFSDGQIPPTAHSRARYVKLSKAPPEWRRAKAKDVAKSFGFPPCTSMVMTSRPPMSTLWPMTACRTSTTSQV